jgi:hypothetical protein
MNAVIHRAGGRGEVENVLYLAAIEGLADVLLVELEARFAAQVIHIGGVSREQVVYGRYGMAFRQEGVA